MSSTSRFISRLSGAGAAALIAVAVYPAAAQTVLADKPVLASVSVPGNLALALSVEFPTAVGNAHIDSTYAPATTYLGYFDPDKCYDYKLAATGANAITVDHFVPAAKAAAHVCSNKWSGNFLNWATMQTIDPFRWALTGGFRVFDTPNATVLEKAYASGQGGTGNFPDRSITNSTTIAGATPLKNSNGTTWNGLKLRVQGMGVQLRFANSGDNNSGNPTAFDPSATSWNGATSWVVSVRPRVCDSTLGASFLESNCRPYSSGYKPEGLIQQYSNQIRFSAFGYLNDGNLSRDGGVLRARQKFVGPTQPIPGGDPTTNALTEWDAMTGVMVVNPDAADASATSAIFGSVANSGVMNYLNKFGASKSYKTYDPVGELYYAALRYYRNLGNVSTWSAPNTTNATTKTTYADGFPVISTWDDPIQYSCQKNFILGIGDVNTHADRNLPGATGNSEPSKPAEVSADTALNATTYTNYVGTMAGINNLAGQQPYGGCCTNNGALMAGMAYWANTNDIRPDTSDIKTTGMQTVQTYWVDVLELQTFKTNNQYYLATKYGGANLPADFNPATRTTDLNQSWWHTGPANDTVGGQLRPDTYFTAAKADTMVSGLASAFTSIASRMKAYSTGFSTAQQQITSIGVASYATQFDAKDWTGEVIASTLKAVDGNSSLTQEEAWRFSTKLATQLAGTGWDTNRYMVTWSNTTNVGVPFRKANIPAAQFSLLNTAYRGNDAQDYLNYLRGDTSQEQGSLVAGSSKAYRTRSSLVGDIVNSKVTVVAPPSLTLSEGANPGYGAYVVAKKNRPNYLVVGTNSGVVHVIDGSLTGNTAGREIFSYVPGAAFDGPSTPSTPGVDGLASLGNPSFNHRFFVDARPTAMDVDFGKTVGGSGTDWRTIVVGGLGKGGKRVYALDLTDLSNVNSETVAASKVLWEFSAADMGFMFGEPVITKTAQYGWVVLVSSGYNNATGKVHLYVLNARTGALITTLNGDITDDGTAASPSGLGQPSTFYQDLTTMQVESVYIGDLKGNVWRADLRNTSGGFSNMVKVARAVGPNSTPQSITTQVVPVVDPKTYRRFLAFGTGKLLNANDINTTDLQRLYAVVDGSLGKFVESSADLPAGVSLPITSANLVQLTDLSQPAVIDFNSKAGWYFDLPGGYRVLNDPVYYLGTVAFAATLPTSQNPCNPSGSSRVYMIDLGSGQTRFANNAVYVEPGFSVTDLMFTRGDKKISLTIGGANESSGSKNTCAANDPTCVEKICKPGDKDCCPPGQITCNQEAGEDPNYGIKILNWREIPLRTPTNGSL
ncbi:pilus assembly protein [Roseateles sp. UC29_93]|uniref:pilus assembly protein n=1 Tax=Roseateles sp. UC29_93 TaxID=3350177 RepID=UPI003671C6AA